MPVARLNARAKARSVFTGGKRAMFALESPRMEHTDERASTSEY